MFNRFLLLIIFSVLLGKSQLFILYPDADLSNTHKLNATDVETIYFLFSDGFKKYSKSNIIENSNFHMCHSKECALDLGREYSANEIVTSKIRVLGSKIIFTGMIFDENGNDEFTSRVTAINVEDMENAAIRLSKSLVNRNSIDEVADIDNIIASDTEESMRRESLHKVGLSLGYLIPFSGSSYEGSDDRLRKSILQFSLSNYWEFQDNKNLFLDACYNFESGFALDLSYNKFINKNDFSPFYGAGIGWHLNYKDGDPEISHGIAPSLNAGAMFFRTYDTNVLFRLKYHVLIPDFDNGLSFNVTLIRKLTPNKSVFSNDNRSRETINRYPLLELLLDILLNR